MLSPAPAAAQTEARFRGLLPPSGGLGLVTWSGGTLREMVDSAATEGCDLVQIWAGDGQGGLSGFLFGAPEFVNQDFNSGFPNQTVPSGEPLLVRCEFMPDIDAPDGLNATFAMELAASINDARRSEGLEDLTVNASLRRAAEDYVLFILEAGRRNDPVPEGYKYPVHFLDGTPGSRAERAGYFGSVYEVVIMGYGPVGLFGPEKRGPNALVAGWLSSPDHRAVLLAPGLTEIGVGCNQRHSSDPAAPREFIFTECVAKIGVR